MQHNDVYMQQRYGGAAMASAVRISEELMREAKLMSSVENRSATGQIEYWAKIGNCAEENPNLTFSLIREILIGLEELDRGESTEYEFG
jgi:hypothetical protein